MYTSLTCDGRVAAGALFGVQAAETLDAVGTVSLRGERLTSQRSFTARADETLLVPHLVLVGHPSFSQSLQFATQIWMSGTFMCNAWRHLGFYCCDVRRLLFIDSY